MKTAPRDGGRFAFCHRVCLAVTILWGAGVRDVASAVDAMTGDEISSTFAVKVAGRSIPVSRYEDLDLAYFTWNGPVAVGVTRLDARHIGEHRIRPVRLGIIGIAVQDTLQLQVDQPRPLVINLDKLRKLILLPQILDPDAPNPAQPAAGVVDVQSLGTDSSGRLDNTTILQAAIDTLPANGTLYFPAGLYRTGSLDLKSDMTLYLADRAVLKGSDDHRRHKFHPRSNTLYFLGAESVRNLHIRGHGLIDANGHAARLAWEKERGVRKIPGRCLPIRNGLNLTLRSVTIRNSCSWSIHLVDADDVQIEGLKVLSNFTDSNGDGLDLDGCNGVRVENCLIYAEDDAISPKAAWSTRSPRNFVIRDCILWSQNATGIRLGSEARSAEFADMLFENIDVLRANTMVRIFNYDGADMHRITFRNLWVEEYTQHAQERAEEEIRRLPEKRGPDHTYLLHVYVRPNAGAPAGQVREVRLENVHAARLVRSALTGAPRPDGVPSIRDIVFRHCTVAGRCLTDATALKISANAHAAPPTVSCP